MVVVGGGSDVIGFVGGGDVVGGKERQMEAYKYVHVMHIFPLFPPFTVSR